MEGSEMKKKKPIIKGEPRLFVALDFGSKREVFQFENFWQAQYFLEAAKEKELKKGEFIIGTSDTRSTDWKKLIKFLETY